MTPSSTKSSNCCSRSARTRGELVGEIPARPDRAGCCPRPFQPVLPIWVGAGGSPESFIRAGVHGLPLMVPSSAVETERFRPLIDLYYKAGKGRATLGSPEGRAARHRLRRRDDERGRRSLLSRLARDVLRLRKGAGLAAAHAGAIRGHASEGRRVFVGNPDEVVEKLRAQARRSAELPA